MKEENLVRDEWAKPWPGATKPKEQESVAPRPLVIEKSSRPWENEISIASVVGTGSSLRRRFQLGGKKESVPLSGPKVTNKEEARTRSSDASASTDAWKGAALPQEKTRQHVACFDDADFEVPDNFMDDDEGNTFQFEIEVSTGSMLDM